MSRARVAELSLLAVAAIWGLTFVLVQDAVAQLPVLAFLAYRFGLATALVAVVFGRSLARLDARGWRSGAVMGALLTAGYVLQTAGLTRTSASHAGFITGLFVVLTPLLGALFGQRAGRLAWGSAAVSAVGLWLLCGVGARVHPVGDALVLACAVAFAAHILATAEAVGTDAGASADRVGALLVIQLGLCAALCLGAATLRGQLEPPRGETVWVALAVTGVLASALGFFVQTEAQRHAPPARTALILAGEPAFAGLFGWLVAGDRLSAPGWLGAGLILAAIVAVDLVPRLRPARPLPEG